MKTIISYLILSLFLSVFLFTRGLSPESLFAQEESSKSLSDKPTIIKQYVVDETGTLSASELSTLIKKLQEFDKQTSTQIVVYLISTLDGEPIENVSVSIAEANKIGRKDKNNGVLLLIAKNDRKLRIEVGYGLEGALTDALSSQIIRKEITPPFKSGKYYEGINRGIDAIIAVTKGEYTADNKTKKDSGGIGCFGIPIFILFIFGFIFFSIVISIIRSIFGLGGRMVSGRRGGGFWGGGGFFGGGGGSSGGFGGFSGGGGSFGGGGSSGSW